MRKNIPTIIAISILAVGAMLIGQEAQAVPIGPNVVGDQFETTHENFDDGSWTVGSLEQPFVFEFDPGAGRWLKNLANSTTLQTGNTWTLTEWIEVGSGLPWIGWTEEFLTEGWEWVEGTISTDAGVIATGDITPAEANAMFFEFAELTEGTIIQIVKEFEWVGTPTQEVWPGVPAEIQILENPEVVPEPAMLSLFGLGTGMFGLVQARRRRRHQ